MKSNEIIIRCGCGVCKEHRLHKHFSQCQLLDQTEINVSVKWSYFGTVQNVFVVEKVLT